MQRLNSWWPTSQWLVNPVIDLLFSCGGLVWILCLAHQLVSFSGHKDIAIAMLGIPVLIGTHLFNETHIIAGLLKVHALKESNADVYRYGVWCAIFLCAIGGCALLIPALAVLLLSIYLLLVVQHYTSQSYGLIVLYCHKNCYRLDRADKFFVAALMNLTACFAVVRLLSNAGATPVKMFGLALPLWSVLPEWVMALTGVVGGVVAVIFLTRVIPRMVARREIFPVPSAMILLTTVFAFVSNNGIMAAYLPIFFHSTQYLALTAKQYCKADTGGFASSSWEYLSLLILGAALLYALVPKGLEMLGVRYELAFAVVFSVASLHHFMIDGVIWKLRDPRVRAGL